MRTTLALALCGSLLAQGGEITIARRGEASGYSIVLRKDAPPNERYAAEELAKGVEQLTGVKLATVTNTAPGRGIYLNPAAPSDLGDDGFALKAKGGDVYVTGGSRGVIYGVHELLETYGGIVWLAPDFTHVPKTAAFAVPDGLDVRQAPAIAKRSLDTFDPWARQDFAVKLRLNESTAGAKWGFWCRPFDRVLGKCHTFGRIIPTSKYYATHPEYFSLVKGKRLKDHPQLCLTNPDVFRIALSTVLERIAANKRDPQPYRRLTRYYGISQDDWNNYCECENCAAIDAREESHAGCVIWFINKLAEEVEKVHPDVMLSTLAYMYGRKPPKYLRPRKNVMICLCTIECDFAKPMTSNRYEENVAFRENVLKWGEISSELHIWDYAANWRATPSPYPNISAMAENIRFYHKLGVGALFEEGISSPSANFTDLKGWVGAKLMWNPDQPTAPLVKRFCDLYYGKASPFVQAYIRLMEAQGIDERKAPMKYAVNIEDLPFTAAFYEKVSDLVAQAEAAVADEDPAIREHVAWLRFGIDYTRAARYAQTGDWRVLNASRQLSGKLDRAEFDRMKALAQAVVKRLDAFPKAIVSSRLNDFRLKGYMRALAAAEFPEPGAVRATLQDWALSYSDHPKSTTIFRIEDKDASDGRAISVTNDGGSWKLTCDLSSICALDAGTKYRLRARIKVKPEPGANPKIGLLAVGLFDRKTKNNLIAQPIFPKQATGQYEWYDLSGWTHTGSESYILHVDPRGSTFSFDCIEIIGE